MDLEKIIFDLGEQYLVDLDSIPTDIPQNEQVAKIFEYLKVHNISLLTNYHKALKEELAKQDIQI